MRKARLDRPRFADHTEFTPDLSPSAMVEAGVFGGGYFHNAGAADIAGIPDEIIDAQSMPHRPHRNLFMTASGLSRNDWIRKGWIKEPDGLGWFQWFIRFHGGRRCADDERQIRRWLDYRNRWEPKDEAARLRQNISDKGRQALLQWAIDPYTPEGGSEAFDGRAASPHRTEKTA
jgi:hypothetical protein